MQFEIEKPDKVNFSVTMSRYEIDKIIVDLQLLDSSGDGIYMPTKELLNFLRAL